MRFKNGNHVLISTAKNPVLPFGAIYYCEVNFPLWRLLKPNIWNNWLKIDHQMLNQDFKNYHSLKYNGSDNFNEIVNK